MQNLAEAKGRCSSRKAEANRQTAMFAADLNVFRRFPVEATANRLHREAWEQLLEQAGRVYFVPDDQLGSGIRLAIPPAEETR